MREIARKVKSFLSLVKSTAPVYETQHNIQDTNDSHIVILRPNTTLQKFYNHHNKSLTFNSKFNSLLTNFSTEFILIVI